MNTTSIILAVDLGKFNSVLCGYHILDDAVFSPNGWDNPAQHNTLVVP